MGRVLSTTMALLLVTASWAGAGTFNVMSDERPQQVSSPLYMPPPSVAKCDFKSNIKSDSLTDLDSEPAGAVEGAADKRSGRKGKAGVSKKPRAARGKMAPSPRVQTKPDKVAQSGPSELDLENELERDLVLSPPAPGRDGQRESPAFTNEGSADAGDPGQRRGKNAESKGKATTKSSKRGASSSPPAPGLMAGKPIRKVKPISGYMWNAPAGTSAFGPYSMPMEPQPLMSDARPRIVPPEMAERFVREGVTIKLAPRTVPAAYPNPHVTDSNSASELVSTVTEIIGLPFAFVSSLF
ncbi:MAG: hypothetical protein AB1646_03040 [Thermodesulfobacteriota bacterium]